MNRPVIGRPDPTLFDRSQPGRGTPKVADPGPDALAHVPTAYRRVDPPPLPQLNEPEVVRHFVRLSQQNHAIDTGFTPLGSCTMKFNPKVNEWAARLPGLANLHPLAPDHTAQGTLRLLAELEDQLAAIAGMHAVTLQPAAGAQGELTALLMIRAYHAARDDPDRDEVLVPDSAHGTNPASVSMAGLRAVTVSSDDRGNVALDAFRDRLGPRTAAVMLTNPSTLGLFEEHVADLVAAVHAAGGLAYLDGANLNAIMGRCTPGAAGFDALHFNLHKTFSTPHGGGGPGAGPVGVTDKLVPFLPEPRIVRDGGAFRLERPGERSASIGRVHGFQGNAGVLVRAYAYISAHGGAGLNQVSDDAVLAANYLQARLQHAYEVVFPRRCMHEFVVSARPLRRASGVRALDVAKRLIDYGFHPPTVYFPLTVDEALLIEPTETESLQTLDAFADAMLAIAEEAVTDPQLVKTAPHTTPLRRLDEATAARNPNLRWRDALVAGGPGKV